MRRKNKPKKARARPKDVRTFLVKVQVSLASSFEGGAVLVYNEDRSVQWQETDPNVVHAMRELLGDAPKGYCLARIDAQSRIEIVSKPIPETNWPEW